ncbi:MAG: ArsR family transcriptional regulator [Methanimicrococcus sp.]|nr:ArsR family transcriptional regulator [Methanimicrococcus sp.]
MKDISNHMPSKKQPPEKEQAKKQAKEQTKKQNKEQATEQNKKQTKEQATEQNKKQTKEQTTEQATEQATEQNKETKNTADKRGRAPNEESQTENTLMFSAVTSRTRQKILQLLAEEDYHISALARELGISVPVTSKHISVLEKAGLIGRKVYGRTHVFSLQKNNFCGVFDSFAPVKKFEVDKGTTLMEAFKRVSVIEVKNIDGKDFIVAADGEKGFYLYEVNGKLIDKRAEDFILEEDAVIEWKRLEPVTRKRLIVSVKKDKDNTGRRKGYYESIL